MERRKFTREFKGAARHRCQASLPRCRFSPLRRPWNWRPRIPVKDEDTGKCDKVNDD